MERRHGATHARNLDLFDSIRNKRTTEVRVKIRFDENDGLEVQRNIKMEI